MQKFIALIKSWFLFVAEYNEKLLYLFMKLKKLRSDVKLMNDLVKSQD